jgi:hypothetical protein
MDALCNVTPPLFLFLRGLEPLQWCPLHNKLQRAAYPVTPHVAWILAALESI